MEPHGLIYLSDYVPRDLRVRIDDFNIDGPSGRNMDGYMIIHVNALLYRWSQFLNF